MVMVHESVIVPRKIQALIDPAIEWKDLSPAEKFDNWLEGAGISLSGFSDDSDHDGFFQS